MALFSKKTCDLCGNEIKLLGNKKLDDGNCCKDCVSKLSPFFSDRRHSTVEEIRQQLEYREANKAEVAAFNTTRSFGTDMKVLLDEDARKFMVTRARNLAEANPDVIDFSDVTGCEIDVQDYCSEQKRKDKDGKSVSYNPPRYDYTYNVYMDIRVNNPYFDNIHIRLNNSDIEINNVIGKNTPNPATQIEYKEAVSRGNEIKQALMNARRQARTERAEAAKPIQPVTCGCCGAVTTPVNGCCEYCGSPVA